MTSAPSRRRKLSTSDRGRKLANTIDKLLIEVFRRDVDETLGRHPKPANDGQLKTGQR